MGSSAAHLAILKVEAGAQHYGIVQTQIDHLGLIDPSMVERDARGQPIVCRDLGPILGGAEQIGVGRRHAMTVVLRRRSVALLIDHIDNLDSTYSQEIQSLSPLITRRLAHPWFLGAIVYQDTPLLLLDLRRIATDVAIGIV